VLDRMESGPKPELVKALGAAYHASPDSLSGTYDVVIDCTGAGSLVLDAVDRLSPGGVCCLLGLAPSGGRTAVDLNALNRELVYNNKALVGSVNANRRHFDHAHQALCRADPGWLGRLITDRVSLDSWERAFESHPDRIKAVIELA
jgi:threonine dehydrogenase-like Zn-dependent dehydrogenase